MKKCKTSKQLWNEFKKRNYQGCHPLSVKKTKQLNIGENEFRGDLTQPDYLIKGDIA